MFLKYIDYIVIILMPDGSFCEICAQIHVGSEKGKQV